MAKTEPGGKGDRTRRQQVSNEVLDLRWKLAFGTDEEREDAKSRLEMIEWGDAIRELDGEE